MMFEKKTSIDVVFEEPALIRVVDDNAMTCESLSFF